MLEAPCAMKMEQSMFLSLPELPSLQLARGVVLIARRV